jgi:endoglucanase
VRSRIALLLVLMAGLSGCARLSSGDDGPTSSQPLLLGTYGLYADPDNPALSWVRAHLGDTARDEIEARIAHTPTARWFDGVATAVGEYVSAAAQRRRMPVAVTDVLDTTPCPAVSSPSSPPSFVDWMTRFADAIGSHPAIVVLEPGALTGHSCLPADDAATAIGDAVGILGGQSPNAHVFLDVSGAGTESVTAVAQRLQRAGIAKAAGFSTNTGGYTATPEVTDFGARLRQILAASTGRDDYYQIVDTSRNGGEPVSAGCNPARARVGVPPDITGPATRPQPLWLTVPGVSDGDCGTAPGTTRGEFVPSLAHQLLTEE